MSLYNNLPARAVALSAEARTRSTIDMWRVRHELPFLPRLARTACGFVLRNETARNLIIEQAAKRLGGAAVVGHGAEQLVTIDENGVKKYVIHSMGKDKDAVEEMADTLQSNSAMCGEYLGEYWLPTTFRAARLPKSGQYIVVARQEHLQGARFYPSAYHVKPSAESRRVAGNIIGLHADTGLLPDLLGAGNVAQHPVTGALCQIDTIPMTAEAQSVVPYGANITIGEIITDNLKAWAA